MHHGRVYRWKEHRGYGFVMPSHSNDRRDKVFVHKDQLMDGRIYLIEGEQVVYLLRPRKGRMEAIHVQIIGPPPAGWGNLPAQPKRMPQPTNATAGRGHERIQNNAAVLAAAFASVTSETQGTAASAASASASSGAGPLPAISKAGPLPPKWIQSEMVDSSSTSSSSKSRSKSRSTRRNKSRSKVDVRKKWNRLRSESSSKNSSKSTNKSRSRSKKPSDLFLT